MLPYDDVFLMWTMVDGWHSRNVWLWWCCHVLVPGNRWIADVVTLLYEEGKIVDDCGDVRCTVMTRWGNGHFRALCHHVLLTHGTKTVTGSTRLTADQHSHHLHVSCNHQLNRLGGVVCHTWVMLLTEIRWWLLLACSACWTNNPCGSWCWCWYWC